MALALFLTLDTTTVHEADAWRFPQSTREARHGWEWATAHCCWLVEHRSWDADWLADAQWRRRCWDLLDDCRRIHPGDAQACRRKLAELRLLLGAEAYWRGAMPDYLPVWRFRDRDR